MTVRTAIVAIGLGLQLLHAGSSPPPASTLLRESWEGYKRDFILDEGRVIDPGRDRQTTSEGQSYALLRAVWTDDRETFDRVWRWTQANLQKRDDHLFGYLWGPEANGLLSTSAAADADQDLALALVFAGHRWRDPTYLREARNVLGDIWQKEVAVVNGTPYLTAGDWAPHLREPGPAVNPSYLSPYAYRIFAREDPAHPWNALVSSSYQILLACSQANLDAGSSVGLPPNWCALDRNDGSAQPYRAMADADLYGYDAFRVMWRVALDYEWFRAPEAKAYLQGSGYLRRQWRDHHRIAAEYGHDGASSLREEPTVYGGDIGNFVVTDPAGARAILQDKLLAARRTGGGVAYWGHRNNYFEQNWVWFGVALATHQIPNLAQAN